MRERERRTKRYLKRRVSPVGSQGGSEGVAVNERQHQGIGASFC